MIICLELWNWKRLDFGVPGQSYLFLVFRYRLRVNYQSGKAFLFCHLHLQPFEARFQTNEIFSFHGRVTKKPNLVQIAQCFVDVEIWVVWWDLAEQKKTRETEKL